MVYNANTMRATATVELSSSKAVAEAIWYLNGTGFSPASLAKCTNIGCSTFTVSSAQSSKKTGIRNKKVASTVCN